MFRRDKWSLYFATESVYSARILSYWIMHTWSTLHTWSTMCRNDDILPDGMDKVSPLRSRHQRGRFMYLGHTVLFLHCITNPSHRILFTKYTKEFMAWISANIRMDVLNSAIWMGVITLSIHAYIPMLVQLIVPIKECSHFPLVISSRWTFTLYCHALSLS